MLQRMFLLRAEENHNPAFHAGKYSAKPFPSRRKGEEGKQLTQYSADLISKYHLNTGWLNSR